GAQPMNATTATTAASSREVEELAAPAAPLRRGSMARNTLSLVAGQFLSTGLTILFSAAIARTLGPADFGLLYLATSIATFAYVFVDWGYGAYVIREIARSPTRCGELMGTVTGVRAVTALVLCVPALITARLLGYDIRTQALILFVMIAWLPMYLGLSFGWA